MCIALHLLGWNLNISINSLFKSYSEFGIDTHTRFHIHMILSEIHFSLSISDNLRSRLHWWRWCHHNHRQSLPLSLNPNSPNIMEISHRKKNEWKTNIHVRVCSHAHWQTNKRTNKQYRADLCQICMSFNQFYHFSIFSGAEYSQLMYVECWIFVMIIFGHCYSPKIIADLFWFIFCEQFFFFFDWRGEITADWAWAMSNTYLIDLKISNDDPNLN